MQRKSARVAPCAQGQNQLVERGHREPDVGQIHSYQLVSDHVARRYIVGPASSDAATTVAVLLAANRPTAVASWIRRNLRPDDAVARALTWATMSASLSKGLFFSVSVLFFTRVAGFTATTVGFGLTVAGAVAVGAALGAGYLARAVGARRVLLATTAGQGVALLAY